MKAYEIIGAMEDTLDIFLESEGTESDKENYDYVMEFLKEELNNKSSSILKYIRNLELDSKIAKDEADRLDNLSKSKMNKVKKLKEYLINIMQYLDKKKIETDLGSYGIRNSINAFSSSEFFKKSSIFELIPNFSASILLFIIYYLLYLICNEYPVTILAPLSSPFFFI